MLNWNPYELNVTLGSYDESLTFCTSKVSSRITNFQMFLVILIQNTYVSPISLESNNMVVLGDHERQ
jgi:hypothetical protein